MASFEVQLLADPVLDSACCQRGEERVRITYALVLKTWLYAYRTSIADPTVPNLSSWLDLELGSSMWTRRHANPQHLGQWL